MRIYIIGNDGIELCRAAPATVNEICSAWPSLRRQTDTAIASYISALRSKQGKVRFSTAAAEGGP